MSKELGAVHWDVFFTDADDEDGPVQMARVGPEAVDRKLEPGDRITLQYLLGSVIRVTRTPTERKEPVQE